MLVQQALRGLNGTGQRRVGSPQLVGQGRVFGLHRAVEAIEGAVMRADDLRGEHLFHRVARAEGGPGGGGGGEACFVLGAGFIGLGAQGGGEGVQEVLGERVVRVEGGFGGHGAGSGLLKNKTC